MMDGAYALDKMNILMIGPDRNVHGGISGVVNGYYEAGLDEKVNLIYIGTMKEGSKLKKLLVALGAYFRFCHKLKWADVVHVHLASDNSFRRKALFVNAAFRKHKKIIIHQHGGDFRTWYDSLSDKGRESVRKVLDKSDHMYVLSPSWKHLFDMLTDADKIEILPNSIKVSGSDTGDILQVKKNRQILFLGRICETKGIRELMDCMPELIAAYPDVRVLLGGIWEDDRLKGYIEKYPDNVRYIGWVSGREKEKYLDESAIFVLPTYFEGQPVSVLEAMAAGCCVVASDVGGIPMMIQDGQNGLLVPPKDVGALSEALRKCLSDDELRTKLAMSARIDVRRDYDISITIDKLVNEYRKLTVTV